MNRKGRRAATKRVKDDSGLVMFSIKAPPLGTGFTVIKTDLRAFDAVSWIDPDAREKSLTPQMLEIDKDIIRAIYYPDDIASIKGRPELFTSLLAQRSNVGRKGSSPAQQPYFDRQGLHLLEITEIDPDRVEWFWTFNTNNKMQLQTNRAWLSPLSNLDMRQGSRLYPN